MTNDKSKEPTANIKVKDSTAGIKVKVKDSTSRFSINDGIVGIDDLDENSASGIDDIDEITNIKPDPANVDILHIEDLDAFILHSPPSSIPPIAPPLPAFLTDEEETRLTNQLAKLHINRIRAGVRIHKPVIVKDSKVRNGKYGPIINSKVNSRANSKANSRVNRGAQGQEKIDINTSKDPTLSRDGSIKKQTNLPNSLTSKDKNKNGRGGEREKKGNKWKTRIELEGELREEKNKSRMRIKEERKKMEIKIREEKRKMKRELRMGEKGINSVGKAMVPMVMPTGITVNVPMEVGMNENGEIRVIGNRDVKENPISKEEVEEALRKNKGFITYAAKEMGVNQTTVRYWVNKYPELQDIIDMEREMDLDRAEKVLGELTEMPGNNQLGAICFTLKCRAKHRGYIETAKLEIGGTGVPITVNLVAFKESDIIKKDDKIKNNNDNRERV